MSRNFVILEFGLSGDYIYVIIFIKAIGTMNLPELLTASMKL